jgi:hypothetical protein
MASNRTKDGPGALEQLRTFALRDATLNLALCVLLAFIMAPSMTTVVRAAFAYFTGLHVWLVIKLVRDIKGATGRDEAAQLRLAKWGMAALWACDIVLYLVLGWALLRR